MRQAPPFDFIGAADDCGDIAFERQDRADFGLRAADLRDVARIGAELIPMALVGQADERVEIRAASFPAQQIPAPVAFFMGKGRNDRFFERHGRSLLIGFDAAVEARQASAEFFAILGCSLPLFFVGNERPVFFPERGDLQLVGIRVGKINASFARRAQAVLGAKIALIGAAAGGNQLEHAVEIFLARR